MKYYKIKIIITFILVSFIYSCVEEYIPRYSDQNSHKVLIFGQITDIEGYQYVSISTSSSIDNPDETVLTDCSVSIIDSSGNSFEMEEYVDGKYRVWMKQDLLKPGVYYKLKVKTSSGEEIVSDFDKMPVSPDLDWIYYVRKDIQTIDPSKPQQGIQFYINLFSKSGIDNYYKWEIEETWEHHASYPKQAFWDGKIFGRVLPDYSKFKCWTTEKLPSFFTLSTKNLDITRTITHPLHFVDNTTQRLTYCYSVKIIQNTLSYSAYNYWEQLRLNNELGGIFGKQPISVIGNLKNITFPDKKVLGIFQTTSVKTKRFFVKNVKNLDLCYPTCKLYPLPPVLAAQFRYLEEVDGDYFLVSHRCVECDLNGGTTIKPDFWPN